MNVATASVVPHDLPALPALLDVQDVANALRCSAKHVFRLARRGGMPAPVRIGGCARWRQQDLHDWILGGCMPCVSNRERTAGREEVRGGQ
jgi:predicted DNA-binding transcriptional regulator AlpA